MANKIFVSYKYKDDSVQTFISENQLRAASVQTTVRAYVDKLEEYFDKTEFAIYKGESDDEDLSNLTDNQIWEKLKGRIFDSTVTIVMISPKMKESNRQDISQWIPWEISYSLKETTRNDRTSHSNALLAIVLPDSNGSYEYFITDKRCCENTCFFYNTYKLFCILRDNMFNKINKIIVDCEQNFAIYSGESSYIKTVKWSNFINSPQEYIKMAIEIKKDIDDYEIRKEV
jgi:hypothetical protein